MNEPNDPARSGANASRDATPNAASSLALSRAIDDSDVGVFTAGTDGRILRINPGLTRLLGRAPNDAIGLSIGELLAGEDAASAAALQARAMAPEGLRAELQLVGLQGAAPWVAAVVHPIVDAHGAVTQVVGVLTDITATKLREALQHKVLDAMVHDLPMQDVMLLVCNEVERLAPRVSATILAVDRDGRLRPIAAPSLPASYSHALFGLPIGPQCGSCGTAAWLGEPVFAADIATDPLWEPYRDLVPAGLVACWSSPIRANDGRVLGTFAFYYREPRGPDEFEQRLVDVSVHLCALAFEREDARARIHQLAFYDPLTQLANRSMFSANATRMLSEMEHAGASLALLFIDLDRFKLINDTHGHATGDVLLREIARRIAGEARVSDLVARPASDEFVVALPHCTVEQAALAGERLLMAIGGTIELGGMTIAPAACVGVAMYPDDGLDSDTLLRHADMAMRQAKGDGRERLRFFRDDMNRRSHQRLALEMALRQSLQRAELRLHYQPQVASVGSGRLHGVEALARWTHPQFGAVSPAQFIPLAEECGLIDALGRWVLDEACRQLADWRRRGVPVPRVAINLSAGDFLDPDLPARVAQTLQSHGLAPADLTLEMTESMTMNTDSGVPPTLLALHAQGVRLALDDFGTGYSSLSHLHRLPIDELKLDRSFVHDLAASPAAQALINTVLRIGDSLNLIVVAEGVETEAERRFLAERGCAVSQGYLFARPMSAIDLEAWIAAGR